MRQVRRTGAAMAVLALVAACGGSGGAEGAGDRAYAEGRYQEALAAYAPLSEREPSPRLSAKVGAAALHLGQLREATAAYRALGAADPDRADEAADGLERVILAAERRRDETVLQEAVTALRAVAPDRPLGRHALGLVQATDGAVDPAGFSAALAAATEAGEVDSLLARQATALAGIGACEQAVPLFQAGLRRAGRLGSAAAADGLAGCYLRLGSALLPSVPDSAETLFRDAAAIDSVTPVGREALIGFGDARYRQGDLVGAALAYQAAISAGQPDDSIAVSAGKKLNALVTAVVPDSLSTGAP
jgi:tetratricopeptide (TPR) repeat protein